jgi:hypothetical protein
MRPGKTFVTSCDVGWAQKLVTGRKTGAGYGNRTRVNQLGRLTPNR